MIETIAIAAGVPMGVGGYISAAGYLFRRRQRASPGVSPYEYHRAHCGEKYKSIHGCAMHNGRGISTWNWDTLRGMGTPALRARVTECAHGHPYTPENTYRDSKGHRSCRACKTARRQRGQQ